MTTKSIRETLIFTGYNPLVEQFRDLEYPQLKNITYLDHAGTTLYATSLIQSFSADLCSNLYANPHSQSPSSQLTTKRIDDVRLRVLQLFNADPEHFDLIFCANATAGIKLILEAFAAQPAGFRYRYHVDAHTSLVGLRELATDSSCFLSDADVELWLRQPAEDDVTALFGWPAQSNFSGRRLPRDWAGRVRNGQPGYYSLLDAAALVTTAPLDLGDVGGAPDFTVLSFYKMFGFPDLGALIVRKDSGDILRGRRYFGGGTMDAVVAGKEMFSVRNAESLHAGLEDGTLPFHSILALDIAMETQERLYGGYKEICDHAFTLVRYLYSRLVDLKHSNGRRLCWIYTAGDYTSSLTQGPIIAFNMQRADGAWIGYAEVEKLAAVKNIHFRTGGLCNPGGVEAHIGLEPWEIIANYEAGRRCWDDQDIMRGKPTGAMRISLGAMSSIHDVETFVAFLAEFYLEKNIKSVLSTVSNGRAKKCEAVVESLTIYPIKSCGGYKIPPGVPWDIRPHGLAWDREWCLVHLGTGAAIDQKRYNKMVLIRPSIDLTTGTLTINLHSSTASSLQIPLSASPSALKSLKSQQSRVCGDRITALTYDSPEIIAFFSKAVGVPCTLARFPPNQKDKRYFKPHLLKEREGEGEGGGEILLSNESPILVVSRGSVERLNREIECNGGRKTRVEDFRANVVVGLSEGEAWREDKWQVVRIGAEFFQMLGPCRRCHMVCIDQETAERNEEPFVTLSKTRRIGGRVLFGMHAAHLPLESRGTSPRIKVGDLVRV